MTSPELYTLPNSVTNALVARYPDGRWWFFVAVAQGFTRGHEWHPAPAYARYIVEAHNGIEHIYRANLAEIPHMRNWLGVTDEWPGSRAEGDQ